MAGLRATWSVWASSLVWLICASFALPAGAQTPQQVALARTLFEQGVNLADRGDWVGAADRFGRAYALKPTPGIAFNWASALIENGKFLHAQELLLSVVRDQRADPNIKRQCETELAGLAPRIARIRVHVAEAADPGMHVEIDGASWHRAAWDISSPIDPGPHSIVLKRGAIEQARSDVSLREGEVRQVLLAASDARSPGLLARADRAAESRTERSKPTPVYKSWLLWSAVGALVAGGVVTGVVLGRERDPKREAPVMGNATPGVIRW